jgi:hypothetical protein
MNPDFHFVLAMDLIVCTAGMGNVLRTSVCTSPTVLKAEVYRNKNIASVFYGIQCSLNNFELRATIMTNSIPDHNTSAFKTVGLVHTLVRKTFLADHFNVSRITISKLMIRLRQTGRINDRPSNGNVKTDIYALFISGTV